MPALLTTLSGQVLGHKFELIFPDREFGRLCLLDCECGFSTQILNHSNFGGVLELDVKYQEHIKRIEGML